MIQALREENVNISVKQADVGCEKPCAELFEEFRSFEKPLRGVMH